MTNEEILLEVKNSFKLEGMTVSKKQEERLNKYLSGQVLLDDLINDLKEKYTNYNKKQKKEKFF